MDDWWVGRVGNGILSVSSTSEAWKLMVLIGDAIDLAFDAIVENCGVAVAVSPTCRRYKTQP